MDKSGLVDIWDLWRRLLVGRIESCRTSRSRLIWSMNKSTSTYSPCRIGRSRRVTRPRKSKSPHRWPCAKVGIVEARGRHSNLFHRGCGPCANMNIAQARGQNPNLSIVGVDRVLTRTSLELPRAHPNTVRTSAPLRDRKVLIFRLPPYLPRRARGYAFTSTMS